MDDEMIDFANLLALKNHLIVLSRPELEKMYKTIDDYALFLENVVRLIEQESALLLFDDEFKDKILSIMQTHRFDMKSKEFVEGFNEIVGYLNSLPTLPEASKNTWKNNYLAYQEGERKIEFHTTQTLLESIATDAIVFHALRTGQVQNLDEDYFLMSLNYLINNCPKLFKDKTVYQSAKEKIDTIGSKTRIFTTRKKYVKEARKFLEETQKEE